MTDIYISSACPPSCHVDTYRQTAAIQYNYRMASNSSETAALVLIGQLSCREIGVCIQIGVKHFRGMTVIYTYTYVFIYLPHTGYIYYYNYNIKPSCEKYLLLQ